MADLRQDLMSMINGMGQDIATDVLTKAMSDMRFDLDVRDVGTRLQDYVDGDVSSVSFNGYSIKNVIITSPTQVGKTQYIIENCKRNKNRPYMFVMTCANSKAQMAQLKNRLADNGIVSFDLKQATKAKLENKLVDGKCIFIVMMNNGTQIKKLDVLVKNLRSVRRPLRYIVYHDEADTINKADVGAKIDDTSVALSHRYWNDFFDTLARRCDVVIRFHVSATPENCSSIDEINGEDIVVLPLPRDYVGVSEHCSWDGVLGEALGLEIERIRSANSREAVLYCVDRKKNVHSDLTVQISRDYNCVCFSYNGDGFSVYKNGGLFDIGVVISDDISSVLDKLRDEGPVVVVGFNLMDRGISFVAGPNTGNRYGLINKPLTATVMFYSGGTGSYAVGIAQRFGRICGKSRPDILRRVVYCSDTVYNDYVGYLANQSVVFKGLTHGMTMAKILENSGECVKLKRPLDRPALKKVNMEYREASRVVASVDMDLDKMRRLVSSWRVEGASGNVGRLFRLMMANDGHKMESCMVREYLPKTNYDATTNSNTSLKWNLVFGKDGRYHYIRQEAIDYYNSL